VYEVNARTRVLRVVAVGLRRHIYEELASRLRRPSGDKAANEAGLARALRSLIVKGRGRIE
jgi:hypothetical protein